MKKLLIVSFILAGALSYIAWVGIVEASIPVLQIPQLQSDAYPGGTVQIDGGKIARIESLTPLVFTVAPDGDPSLQIRVRSSRLAPENFKEGIPVSLRGEYDRSRNEFVAYKVSTQCPSRYEAAKEAKKDASGAGASGAGALGTDVSGAGGLAAPGPAAISDINVK